MKHIATHVTVHIDNDDSRGLYIPEGPGRGKCHQVMSKLLADADKDGFTMLNIDTLGNGLGLAHIWFGFEDRHGIDRDEQFGFSCDLETLETLAIAFGHAASIMRESEGENE